MDQLGWFFPWVGVVKYGEGLLCHWTLKSGLSQEWIDELSLFFVYASRDAKVFMRLDCLTYSVSLTFICRGSTAILLVSVLFFSSFFFVAGKENQKC